MSRTMMAMQTNTYTDNYVLGEKYPVAALAAGDFSQVAQAINLDSIDEVAFPVVLVGGPVECHNRAVRTLFNIANVPYYEVKSEEMGLDAEQEKILPLVYVGSECIGQGTDVYAEFMSGKFLKRLNSYGIHIGNTYRKYLHFFDVWQSTEERQLNKMRSAA